MSLYRQESAKIIKVLQQFSDVVEKASCDEAFIDVTSQVEIKFKLSKTQQEYDDQWSDALFMGFEKGEGRFMPATDQEKKLWIANSMAN